jgi:hypothetical protein
MYNLILVTLEQCSLERISCGSPKLRGYEL